MSVVIRPFRADDVPALRHVCLVTADSGGDATGVYDSDDLMPDLFCEPYLRFFPELAFVLADEDQPVGYVIAAGDTVEFARRYREEWIPRLADRYTPLTAPPASPTEHLLAACHFSPERLVRPEFATYPAHLHIDVLPPYQGRGHGRMLIATLLEALGNRGIAGVHISMLTSNAGARVFYDRVGFSSVDVADADTGITYLIRATS